MKTKGEEAPNAREIGVCPFFVFFSQKTRAFRLFSALALFSFYFFPFFISSVTRHAQDIRNSNYHTFPCKSSFIMQILFCRCKYGWGRREPAAAAAAVSSTTRGRRAYITLISLTHTQNTQTKHAQICIETIQFEIHSHNTNTLCAPLRIFAHTQRSTLLFTQRSTGTPVCLVHATAAIMQL